MAEYFDISPALSLNTPAWPTDPPLVFEEYKSISQGGGSNVTKLTLGSHAGSHVDAPLHFFPGGTSVDKLSLDVLIGEVLVIEVADDKIDRSALEGALGDDLVRRLLFKTKNSTLWSNPEFVPDFVGLTADGAEYLVKSGIELVGIDYLSIEAAHGKGAPTHRILLENKIIILESLNMTNVVPGKYELICLPLKLENVDGAPARVVLRR
ncbi:MAG TPA: cyclase family protein [Actinobacteria bacterium]|nr:cyclase family protein [Actinomycetota bacterium]